MKRRLGWLAAAAGAAALLAIALPPVVESRLPEVELPLAMGQPDFDPIRYFEGTTQGEGTLYIVDGSAIPIRVASTGVREDDGSLTLTQEIREGDKPPRKHTWTMRQVGKGQYETTLSDAVGPVDAHVEGNLMIIAYETKGERIRQELVLNRDRRTVSNRLDAYKWGLNVARLDETIGQK